MTGRREQLRPLLLLLCACQPSPERLAERLLTSPPRERHEAIRRLGEMGAQARPAVPALRRFLREDHPVGERAEVALALGFIGDPQAIPELVQGLQTRSFSELEWNASASLARIGPAALPALIATLDDGTRCSWAANALKLMGPPAAPALPALRIAFAKERTNTVCLDSMLGAGAAIAQDPGQTAAIQFVCSGLHHTEPTVRRSAARSLWDIGRRGVTGCPDLANAVHDSNAEVVDYARKALDARH